MSVGVARIMAGLLFTNAPAHGQVQQVAVEPRLAQALGLHLGDTIHLGSAPDSLRFTAVVAALFTPKSDPATLMRRDFQIRLHLPALATLLGQPDRVDRFGVVVRPGANPDSVATALNRTAYGFRAFTSREVAGGSSQTFRVVSRFHRAIAIISIVASAVFLLCIMLLKVEERRIDAAVMRFIGVRRRTIFGALLLEACLVALIGSGLGVGLAYGAGALTNFYYQRLFHTSLIFSLITPDIVLESVVLALTLGLVAGALAALRLVRTPPLTLWGRG